MPREEPPRSVEETLFDANLREFGQQVGILCALEQSGKISPAETYRRIKDLWHQLKRSKKGLGIGIEDPPSGEESRD
jgi:hypothetical protein